MTQEQRVIKFRAWLRNVGIMLSVYVLDQTGNAGRGTHFERSKGYGEHGGQFVFNIDDAELMQFTGLHDKNKVEIYEGDILRDDEATYRIFWDNECSRFDCERLEDGSTMRSFACYDMTILADIIGESKVIGNIYVTPNLLTP